MRVVMSVHHVSSGFFSLNKEAIFRAAHVYVRHTRRPLPGAAPRCAAATVQVTPPPPSYDFRAETDDDTRAFIDKLHPDLNDLATSGTIVVVRRPLDYEERRSDGYREPETIVLVGTAHVSKESAADVWRVVRSVQPEHIVVELCRSRAGTMYEEPSAADDGGNLMILSGENYAAAMGRSLRLGGRSAMAFRVLLAAVSKRVSATAGVQTGEEFRAARQAAEEMGAQIVLGDRPIEITLRRAWGSLSWREKIGLVATLLQGATSARQEVTEEALEAMKEDDVLSMVLAEISARFPSLMAPLVHERDVYLAWSLKRSKAVNGSSTVVGVMGRGHLRGVVYALKNNQEKLRFKDLVGSGDSAESNLQRLMKLSRRLLVEAAAGGALWYMYDFWVRQQGR